MYERFFHLREKPFALTPDPAYLFLATRHQHALTMLEYVLGEDSGFAVITGDVGCGKTLVVRHFLEKVDRVLRVGFVTNTHSGLGALLPWVMESLGIPNAHSSPSELYHRFVALAKQDYAAGRRLVLVIDEAQNLGMAGLEELRVLSNVNTGKEMLVQTILVGQPELRTLLRRRGLRQFAQRIAMEYHLEPLQEHETAAYIAHRIQVAGGRQDLFEADSLQLIHRHSGGVPRLVNIICDTALVYAFADQRAQIEPDIIVQVIKDRSSGGLLPVAGNEKVARPRLAAG